MPIVAPAEAAPSPGPDFPHTAGRLEDARLLAGRGRYIDDLPVGPGTLHAAILRSPHAHALVRRIDLGAGIALDRRGRSLWRS